MSPGVAFSLLFFWYFILTLCPVVFYFTNFVKGLLLFILHLSMTNLLMINCDLIFLWVEDIISSKPRTSLCHLGVLFCSSCLNLCVALCHTELASRRSFFFLGRIRETESVTKMRQLENWGLERPWKGHLSCGFQTYLAASPF